MKDQDRSDSCLRYGAQVVMRVTQGHRRELLQSLESLHKTAVEASGMSACDLMEDTVVPNRLMWVEWWRTEDEVEAALGSERLTMLLAVAGFLGSVESVRRIQASQPLERRTIRNGEGTPTNS